MPYFIWSAKNLLLKTANHKAAMTIIALIFLAVIFSIRHLNYYNKRIKLIKIYHEVYIENNKNTQDADDSVT